MSIDDPNKSIQGGNGVIVGKFGTGQNCTITQIYIGANYVNSN